MSPFKITKKGLIASKKNIMSCEDTADPISMVILEKYPLWDILLSKIAKQKQNRKTKDTL